MWVLNQHYMKHNMNSIISHTQLKSSKTFNKSHINILYLRGRSIFIVGLGSVQKAIGHILFLLK